MTGSTAEGRLPRRNPRRAPAAAAPLNMNTAAKTNRPSPADDHQKLVLRPGKSGLLDLDVQRRSFQLLLLDVEVLQGFLDLLAPRSLYATVRPCGSRLGARDARAPLLGLALARKQRIKENPGHAADRGRHHADQGEGLHFHRAAPIASPRSIRRWKHPAPPQAACPRRSSGRGPRTSAGRCRSSLCWPIRLPLASSPVIS